VIQPREAVGRGSSYPPLLCPNDIRLLGNVFFGLQIDHCLFAPTFAQLGDACPRPVLGQPVEEWPRPSFKTFQASNEERRTILRLPIQIAGSFDIPTSLPLMAL
jgi:hypothetical protein